jgi:predicted metal-dependent hydrolase
MSQGVGKPINMSHQSSVTPKMDNVPKQNRQPESPDEWIEHLIDEYEHHWHTSNQALYLDTYLKGIPPAIATEVREYLEAFLWFKEAEILASRPPFKDRLAELHRRLETQH